MGKDLNDFWRILLILAPIFLVGTLIVNAVIHWTYIENYLYYGLNLTASTIAALLAIAIILISAIFAFIFYREYRSFTQNENRMERIENKNVRQIMTKITALLVILLILGSFGTMIYGFSLWDHRFYTEGPYLTYANDQDPATEITICWRTTTPSTSVVRYGTSIDELSEIVTSEGRVIHHHVFLNDLLPNTVYYYEVESQDFGIKEFQTAPMRGQPAEFTFTLWADPRTNNHYTTAVSQPNINAYMAEELATSGTRQAFSIAIGDISDTGPSFETWAMYLKDICTSDFASNASNVIAVGNHEHHADPEGRYFRDYFPYQQGNFSFVYGHLYVLVLNIFDYEEGKWYDVNFPQEQFEWAKQDLEAHADIPFKIIAIHPSPINRGEFTTGGHHGNISTELLYLCSNYGVDALFTGHSHHYAVYELDGTHFIKIGIGGNANRYPWHYDGSENDVTRAGGSVLASGGEDTGWLRVDMTPTQMHIRPIMIDGTEYPGYTLNATS